MRIDNQMAGFRITIHKPNVSKSGLAKGYFVHLARRILQEGNRVLLAKGESLAKTLTKRKTRICTMIVKSSVRYILWSREGIYNLLNENYRSL